MPPKAPAVAAPIKVDAACEEGSAGTRNSFLSDDGIMRSIYDVIVMRYSIFPLAQMYQALSAPWLLDSRPPPSRLTLPSQSPRARMQRRFSSKPPSKSSAKGREKWS
jgi:hypothetical protein